MIEPIVGQELPYGSYAPMFSGFGYTSTSKGEGYINIVPGLGGGVDRRDSEKINFDALKEVKGNLQNYVMEYAWVHRDSTRRKSALLDFENTGLFLGNFMGKAYYAPNKFYGGDLGGVSRGSLDFWESDELKKAYSELNLNPLFDMMKKMEDEFGCAQYFEWALKFEDGEQKFGLLQIADINKKIDEHQDFGSLENILLVANNVTGVGVKECSKLFRCWNPHERDELYDFNQQNKDYVLVYPARLVTSMNTVNRLNYRHFSNASVFLEIPDAEHCDNPISHLTGQLDMTGKFFGVLDYSSQTDEMWDRLELKLNDKIYSGNIKVHASERQDMMAITALD